MSRPVIYRSTLVLAALSLGLIFALGLAAQFLYFSFPQPGQVWVVKGAPDLGPLVVLRSDRLSVTFVQQGYTITLPRRFFLAGAVLE